MFRSPSMAGLPHIQTMLDDIPAPLHQVAAHLGLKESTLQTYKRTGNAPRAVLLALYWETRWGVSQLDCELFNAAQVHRGESHALRDHVGRLAGIIWDLELELDRHQDRRPANLPIFNVG